MRLSDFQVLSFDCYGTLIDWETGIHQSLRPWLECHGIELTRDDLLEAFAQEESAAESAAPETLYSELLTQVHHRLADRWTLPRDAEEAARFGGSVGRWPPFPDSAPALAYLKQHYRLVILSNVDRASFAGSNATLGVEFDEIFTAEEIGSYKPDPANFRYMLDALAARGFDAGDVLHTAQSLFHDHEPAVRLGLTTCWIDRRFETGGFGATAPPSAPVRVDFRFVSLEAMAEAHANEVGRA